ncbi:hypothetical protein ACWEWK_04680 [Streptomyces sp. NPDC003757]
MQGVAEPGRRARRGDPAALSVIERAGRRLGVVVSGAVSFAPGAVVLDGVYRELMDRLAPAVDRELARRVVSGLWSEDGKRLRAASSLGDAARGRGRRDRPRGPGRPGGVRGTGLGLTLERPARCSRRPVTAPLP